MFSWDNNMFSHVSTFNLYPDTGISNNFEGSYAISNDGMISSILFTRALGEKGRLQLYEYNGTSWAFKGSPIDGNEDYRQPVVTSFSDDNNTFVVLYYYDENSSSVYSLRVYNWDTTTNDWVIKGSDINDYTNGIISDDGLSIIASSVNKITKFKWNVNDWTIDQNINHDISNSVVDSFINGYFSLRNTTDGYISVYEDTTSFYVRVVNNAFFINSVSKAEITFTSGETYVFDQSDSTNAGQQLVFGFTPDDTANILTSVDGVTIMGTPGQTGAYTQIDLSAGFVGPLYYYSLNSNDMGYNPPP